jgi:hypothetical protein
VSFNEIAGFLLIPVILICALFYTSGVLSKNRI